MIKKMWTAFSDIHCHYCKSTVYVTYILFRFKVLAVYIETQPWNILCYLTLSSASSTKFTVDSCILGCPLILVGHIISRTCSSCVVNTSIFCVPPPVAAIDFIITCFFLLRD